MRTSSIAVAAFTLLGTLTACSATTGSGSSVTGVPSPEAARGAKSKAMPVGRPAHPPQYTPVADADWDIHKPLVGRVRPCQNGKIMIFECQGVELLAFLPSDSIGGVGLRAIWGWIDSTTGREFALAGADGMAFVEVTDPLNPRYLGTLPGNATDVKVYKNHAFIVNETGDGKNGMAVFDLSQLRAAGPAPVTFQAAAYYDGTGTAHTIALNEATGFAYLNMSNAGLGTPEPCGGGLHMVDVRDPVHPVFAGCYNEPRTGQSGNGMVHDTQCVLYHGPDQRYRGREICLNSALSALSIADVTDKKQPKTLSVATYPKVNITHQGWLSEDQRYFFVCDEFDENVFKIPTRTIIFDMAVLDDPVVVTEFFGTTMAQDHNLFVRGHYLYQSTYEAGLRILDGRDPKHVKEVGYLFLPPKSESWTNYPFFTKDVVAVPIGPGLSLVRRAPTEP